jgi:hypothetical protein
MLLFVFLKIFATIENQIENKRKVKPGLIHDYHKFVTDIGNQIVGTMNHELHLHIAKRWQWQSEKKVHELNVQKDKKIEKAETKKKKGKLDTLINLFLTEVYTLKLKKIRDIHEYMYGIQHVATKIDEICKGDVAEKQLAFFLDLFVANLIYIEYIRNDMHITHQWEILKIMAPKDDGALKEN